MRTLSTLMKTLVLGAGMLLSSNAAMAGDGTKENPYTVAELNAQKDALATSGETVWVKADLKGLGEDGLLTVNTENNQMAALFGDATGEFVAYSYQILNGLAVSDLTNTKNLLISLTYGTTGHPYGNTTYPQYASDYEKNAVTVDHFSLEEVHGALSLKIENGFRGFHIASCYALPKEMVAARVSSNYSKGTASVNYGYYDGAEEGKNYIISKNTALVLMAFDGTYDLVLSAGYYEQINSNSLNGGETAGNNVGTGKSNENRWCFRFVSDGNKVGFERNSDENCTVLLASKDEIFLKVNSSDDHFGGNWEWETLDKKWITWKGQNISDFHEVSAIRSVNKEIQADVVYSLQGVRMSKLQKGLNIVNGKKVMVK